MHRIHKIIKISGRITKSELTRNTQNLQTHIRDDILTTLQQSNQIIEWIDAKTKIHWYAVKNA